MNVLIVGAGSVGKRHAKNLLRHNVSVSMVDPRPDRLKDVKAFTDKNFANIDDALKHSWDAAVVASPPHVHVDQCDKLVSKSIPILLEKPICPTLEEAMKLESRSDNILLGYTYRWWEPFLYFKNRLHIVGDLYRLECCMGAHLADWHPWERYQDFFMAHKHMGGGALLDESHVIDLMLWLVGPPNSVFGSVKTISDLEITTDDNVESIWFYDKMLVSIHLDLYRRPHDRSITAFGSEGTIKWSFDKVQINDEMPVQFAYDRNDMFVKEIEHFLDFVAGRVKPKCTYQDGLNVLRIIECIRNSSNEGKVMPCEM